MILMFGDMNIEEILNELKNVIEERLNESEVE